MHGQGTSFFGTASCMSCFGYFVSWPGLFRFGAAETSFRGIFRKAILSAFLLLCSHGRKNDIAMLRKFLRKGLSISLRLRKSLRKMLGIRYTNAW